MIEIFSSNVQKDGKGINKKKNQGTGIGNHIYLRLFFLRGSKFFLNGGILNA